MNQNLYDLMEDNPVIAAVSDMEGLKTCCGIEEIKVVFILFGDICNISSIVGRLRESNKTPIVHIDLVKGLDSKEIAVDFIKDYVKAEGIISTKPFLIKRARELSLCTVLRIFLLDSMALANIQTGGKGNLPHKNRARERDREVPVITLYHGRPRG